MRSDVSFTEQLQRFSGGDREIAEAVLREVLPKLHRIAEGQLARERYVKELSPTELIHEVWLRSLHKGGWQIRDREHFYAIAASAMRHVLVDFARARLAQMRGGGVTTLPLDEARDSRQAGTTDQDRIIEIGMMMNRLERYDPLAAQLVDLHYFAGFTLEETGEVMKLSLRQIRHRWLRTKLWLQQGLSG